MDENEAVDGEVTVEQPEIDEKKAKKFKAKLRYLSKFYPVYFCAIAFLIFLEIAVIFYGIHGNRYYNGETFAYKIWGGLFVALAVAAGIAGIAYSIVPTKLYDSEKIKLIYCGKPFATKKKVLNLCYYIIPYFNFFVMLFISIINLFAQVKLIVSTFNIPLSISFIFLIITVVNLILTSVMKKKNLNGILSLLENEEQLNDFAFDYNSNGKIKPFELKNLVNFRGCNKKSLIRKIAVEASCIVAVIVIFCLAAFIPPNPFNKRSVDKIDIGDNSGYVYRMFGASYDRSEDTFLDEKGNEVKYGTWKWCSSDLAKKIATKTKQLEKLSEKEDFSEDTFEKMSRLTEQILNLELELSMTKCDYVTVNFINGKVTQVEFKKDYSDLEP